jgi:hypothetical protein
MTAATTGIAREKVERQGGGMADHTLCRTVELIFAFQGRRWKFMPTRLDVCFFVDLDGAYIVGGVLTRGIPDGRTLQEKGEIPREDVAQSAESWLF